MKVVEDVFWGADHLPESLTASKYYLELSPGT